MTQEVGKLGELNIKPGDVLEYVGTYDASFTSGKHYTATERGYLIDDDGYEWIPNYLIFRVVSRASDAPKLLRDMTDAEIGALVRANARVWIDLTGCPFWQPTRKTVTIAIDGNGDVSDVLQDDDEARIQFDRVDGVIDRSTLRWEENQ
jgi:hypothetical protein